MQQLQKVNRIIFLIPEVISNLDEGIIKKKNLNKEQIKEQSQKQSREFVIWLSKFFNCNWDYSKNQEGHPFLHELTYKEKEDLRYLCVFRRKNEDFSLAISKMSAAKRVLVKQLFRQGWSEANTLYFTSAPGGTHNTSCDCMMNLIPNLNLKFDKSDVILDIGYGTGRLLFAFSAMLGTTVYGTDIDLNVFNHTKSICESLKSNIANK